MRFSRFGLDYSSFREFPHPSLWIRLGTNRTNDEEAVAPLEELQKAYPNADIYLNGQLTIDFPEEVKIPIEPNQMVTASVVGNSIRLNYCGLEKAIAYLNAQYAVVR
jgi:hypothetical protein